MPKETDFFQIDAVSAVPLLAPSPDSYHDLHNICNIAADDDIRAYSMTNIGLQADLQLAPYCLNVYAARLNFGGSPTLRFGFLLARQNPRSTRFFRVSINGRSLVRVPDSAQTRWMSIYISRSPLRDYPCRGSAHHQAASLLAMQEYSIRIHAPDLLGTTDNEFPCTVLAHHEWKRSRNSDKTLGMVSQSIDPVAEQSHHQPSGFQTGGRTDEQVPIIAVADDAGNSPTDLGSLRSEAQATDDHALHENPEYDTQAGAKTSVRRNKGPFKKGPELSLRTPKFQSFGTLRLPPFRGGLAGAIVFSNANCGTKCIKVGFDFGFRPVVFLGTVDEDASEGRYGFWGPAANTHEYRDLDTTVPSSSSFSTQNLDHARKFWEMQPDLLCSTVDLAVTPEGVIDLGGGIYAFCLPDATSDGERWIFKQNESQSWYLSIELRREGHGHMQSWVLDIERHEERVQIVVHLV